MKPVWKLGEQKTLTLEIPLQPPPQPPTPPLIYFSSSVVALSLKDDVHRFESCRSHISYCLQL